MGMASILKLALLVTGVLTLLVGAMPDLIVIGLLFLILPGLILSAMPTIFLYLVLFSGCWFWMRGRGEITASVVGALAVALVALGVPSYFNLQTSQGLVEAEQREVVPKEKIGVSGNGPIGLVVVEVPQRILGWNDCDELCQLLLYNDVAAKVMIRNLEEEPAEKKKNKNHDPKIYRIAREDCMVDPEIMRKLKDSRSPRWSTAERSAAVAKAVRMRMSGEECLVGEEAVATRGDLRIRWVDETLGAKVSEMKLWPGVPWMKGVEVRIGDKVVARETERGAALLQIPLHLEPISSGMGFRGWRWGRKVERGNERQQDRVAMLRRLTALDLEQPRGLDQVSVRKRLDLALNDPGGSNAAFALLTDYYKQLVEEGFEVGDRERLARLVADPRVTEFGYFEWSEKQRTGVGERIRDAILRRMLAEQGMEKKPVTARLDGLVGRLSKGTFAGEVPVLDELLADGKERRWYPQTVKRLAEQGKVGVEKLVRIVEQAWSLPDKGFAWGKDAEAATEALCQMGESAAEFLPRLKAVQGRHEKNVSYLRGHTWRGMLVSLGADPGEFRSENYPDLRRYAEELRRAARGCRVVKR
jgi:hypothetical protein